MTEHYLTDSSGVSPYHWTAVVVDAPLLTDRALLDHAREELSRALRTEFGSDPDVVLLLPPEEAGELLETTFDHEDPEARVLIAATVWRTDQPAHEPGDVKRIPADEWTDDERLRIITTLGPNTPPEAAEAMVSLWRDGG